MNFTRSEHPAVGQIGETYLRLSGELLDGLFASAQADVRWVDGYDRTR